MNRTNRNWTLKSIEEIGACNNGYITRKDLERNLIASVYLTRLIKSGRLIKLARGIYILPGYPIDDFYTNQLIYPSIVYTRNSAAYLHDLSTKQISVLEGVFRKPYHISHEVSFKVYYETDDKYNLGLTKIETPCGNTVNTYDIERCICDYYLYKFTDSEEFKWMISECKKRDINRSKLFRYAILLGVLEQINILLETVL